jgi:hypothetical protein
MAVGGRRKAGAAGTDGARRLFEVLHADHGEVYENFFVCTACGLPRPCRPISTWGLRTDPEFFDACPACGETKWMWLSRTMNEPQPWWQVADGLLPSRTRNGDWAARAAETANA